MKYNIITFLATVNGGQSFNGTIGAAGDYNPNITKGTIEQQLHKNYPNSKIAVVLQDIEKVNVEQYMAASKNFIEITK